jgi:hypothetical protein
MAAPDHSGDTVGGCFDSLDVSKRGAAEFLNEPGHIDADLLCDGCGDSCPATYCSTQDTPTDRQMGTMR